MIGISNPAVSHALVAPAKPVVRGPLSPASARAIDEARNGVQVRLTMAESRKALARAKLRDLKDQIAKMSVVALVDPKGYARLIAGMARQLEAAAQGYAGGDTRAARADAQSMEDGIAALGGGPTEPTSAPLDTTPTAQAQQLKAYLALPPEKALDEHFVFEVATLRRTMGTMFDAALARLKGDENALADEVRDFAGASAETASAERAILNWWAPSPVQMPAAPTPVHVTA